MPMTITGIFQSFRCKIVQKGVYVGKIRIILVRPAR
jgi:hypothetical protein